MRPDFWANKWGINNRRMTRMSQWKEYQKAIKGCDNWHLKHPLYLLVSKNCQKLSRYKELPSVKLSEQILEDISRGHALIPAASNWKNPSIGKNAISEIAQCRGQQWRCFQAFSGFKVLTKAVFGYDYIKKGK
jgi:hypothetical protein